MRKVFPLLSLLALLSLSGGVRADLSVFACEPEWQALVRAIGGEGVSVTSATTAAQDPHHIQARPSLIARLRRADLLICTGAELEAGWLPVLLRRARNPAVQPGRPGHLLASDQVALLEVPQRLDRSEGDIHAQGNPHLHLDPRNIPRVARALVGRLARIDPDHAAAYEANGADFGRRWEQAVAAWTGRTRPLRGKKVVVHHTEWIYLLDWLGMERLAALEPKPGVPPTAGHLAELERLLQSDRPYAIIRSPIDDSRPSNWLAQRSGTPALVLPYTVDGEEGGAALFGLFEGLLDRLSGVGR